MPNEYYISQAIYLIKTDLEEVIKILDIEDEKYTKKKWHEALLKLEGIKLDLEMAIDFLE